VGLRQPLRAPLLLFGGPYSNLRALTALRAPAAALGIDAARTNCTGDVVAYCAEPGRRLRPSERGDVTWWPATVRSSWHSVARTVGAGSLTIPAAINWRRVGMALLASGSPLIAGSGWPALPNS